MARDAVDHAARVAQLPSRPCATASLKLHGWHPAAEDATSHLDVYGSDLPDLKRLAGERPDWNTPLHPALPYIAAEVIWAVRHEAARTVGDVLCRRTRALFLDARASLESAPRVAELMAAELGCDLSWQSDQVARFKTLAEGFMIGRS